MCFFNIFWNRSCFSVFFQKTIDIFDYFLVYTDYNRILICFVSLVLLRLIQKELNNHYSVKKIVDTLNQCEGVSIEKNLYVFSYFSEELAVIAKKFNLPLNRKYLTRKEMKKILAETKLVKLHYGILWKTTHQIPLASRDLVSFTLYLLSNSSVYFQMFEQ